MSETKTPALDSASSDALEQALPQGKLRAIWESWTHRIITLREDQFFLFLAVLIGIFSGLAVVCFRIAIESMHLVLLGPSLGPPPLRVILVPCLAGLGVAFLIIHVFPQARGSGVNQIKAALYISNGYVPFKAVVGKFLTCALAIGSGQSLGPEDPSLHMGAGIASAISRRLLLPSIEQQREQMPLTVEGAMEYDAAIVVAPAETVTQVLSRLEATPRAPILLYVRTGEWHLVDRENLLRLAADDSGHLPVTQAGAKGPLPVVFRDQSLEEALRALGDWSLLPVVSRADLSRLEGVLTLPDILRAFRTTSVE
jgi:CBS domain-containing protein